MIVPVAGKAFLPFVTGAARKYDVPPALIYAIMAQESGFRATAYRAEVRIKDGSHGLMQLLWRTAVGLGFRGEPGEASKLTGLYDPATNIDLGAKLLAQELARCGTIEGAISAYNGGYRPSIGFGKPASRPMSICLAWDEKTNQCARRREVAAGTFANATYVGAVMARIEAYTGDLGPHVA